jgi:hypothetical protein
MPDLCFVFLMKAESTNLIKLEEDEIKEFKWIDLDNL